jgi:hypothetical protein
VVVNRPLLQAGRFAGTMNVSVPTAYLAQQLAALALDARDVVAIVNDDGSFVARSRDHLTWPWAARCLPCGPFSPTGSPSAASSASRARSTASRASTPGSACPGRGLVVAVGLAEDDALAPLAAGRDRERRVFALLLAVVLAAGAAVAALLWQAARQQRAIEGSERRYRSLLDTLPDATFLVRNGLFAYVNPATLRLFGANDAAQLIGQPVLDHIHPDFHATR